MAHFVEILKNPEFITLVEIAIDAQKQLDFALKDINKVFPLDNPNQVWIMYGTDEKSFRVGPYTMPTEEDYQSD